MHDFSIYVFYGGAVFEPRLPLDNKIMQRSLFSSFSLFVPLPAVKRLNQF